MPRDRRKTEDRAAGSVWTSFSDLFTSMSVIFLVMFVIAVLKLTLSSLETAKTKDAQKRYLEGEVPEEIQTEVARKTEKVQNTITDINKIQLAIQQKSDELDALMANVKSHQSEVEALLKHQAKNDTLLQKVNKDLKVSQTLAKQRLQAIAQLENNLDTTEQEYQTLQELYAALNQKSQSLDKQLASSQKKIKSLENSNHRTESKLQSEIATLKTQLSKRNLEFDTLDKINQKLAIQSKDTEVALRQKISDSLELISQKERSLSQLNSDHEQLQNKYAAVSQELEDEKLVAIHREKTLKNTKRDLLNKIKQQDKKISNKAIEILENQDTINRYAAINKNLNQKNTTLQNTSKELIGKLNSAQDKNSLLNNNLNELQVQNSSLNQQLFELNGQNKSLQSKYESERGKALSLAVKNLDLSSSVKHFAHSCDIPSDELDRVAAIIGETWQEKPALHKREHDSDKSYASKSPNYGNKQNSHSLSDNNIRLASQNSQPKSMRGQIAKKLANRFDSMQVDVVTNQKTGNITLFLDEAFLFKNNSYELRNEVQAKLTTIIPVYTDELFKDDYIKENIASVNIIGHASPYYMAKFVNPETASFKAFEHNLTLSTNRALQITKFILGNEIGNYPFKSILRKKIKPTGKSFMEPILKAASDPEDKCQAFSCKRSRRVEISFSLNNEDKKTKSSIENMQTFLQQQASIPSVEQEITPAQEEGPKIPAPSPYRALKNSEHAIRKVVDAFGNP